MLDTLQTMYASLQEQADLVTNTKLSKNALTREQSAEVSKEKVDHHYCALCFLLCCCLCHLFVNRWHQDLPLLDKLDYIQICHYLIN